MLPSSSSNRRRSTPLHWSLHDEAKVRLLLSHGAAIDAKHRESVLTSVVDAVDDTVARLTSRGLIELDDYERKALVRDLKHRLPFRTARVIAELDGV